jgi:hypothetical protein
MLSQPGLMGYLVIDMLQAIKHNNKNHAQKCASTYEHHLSSALKKPVTNILICGQKPWF